jgi:hypothetical protein
MKANKAPGGRMDSVEYIEQPRTGVERRRQRRAISMSQHMAEFKFKDSPTYQLKLQDVSPGGAGIIVRPDSKFLAMVTVGQELNLRLLAPQNSEIATGDYSAFVEHVSELKEGRYKGHFVVGLSTLKKIS